MTFINLETMKTVPKRGFDIWWLKWFYESFEQGLKVGMLLNYSIKNLTYRHVEKK